MKDYHSKKNKRKSKNLKELIVLSRMIREWSKVGNEGAPVSLFAIYSIVGNDNPINLPLVIDKVIGFKPILCFDSYFWFSNNAYRESILFTLYDMYSGSYKPKLKEKIVYSIRYFFHKYIF